MRPSRPLLTGLAVVLLAVLAWRESAPRAPGSPPSAGIGLPDGSAAPPRRVRDGRDAGGRVPSTPAAGARETAAAGRRADFDFYLLSLTLEPALSCEDGNQRIGQRRALDDESFARTPLVLHGLWPEAREAGRYPRDCPGPRLDLQPQTRADLGRWMHPACARPPSATSGARTAPARASTTTRTSAPRSTARAWRTKCWAMRFAATSAAASTQRRCGVRPSARGRASARTWCSSAARCASADPAERRRPHLLEVRLCVDDDGPGGAPGSLLRCGDVGRRDQGCGGSFMIDAV